MINNPDFLGNGWSFPPNADPVTGRITMCTGEEDIKQSIKIILLTRLNERVMLPLFGCGMHNFIFEVTDDASIALFQNDIISALTIWEPRIINTNVDVDISKGFDGIVLLNISYTVRATNNPNNLVFPYYIDEGVGNSV